MISKIFCGLGQCLAVSIVLADNLASVIADKRKTVANKNVYLKRLLCLDVYFIVVIRFVYIVLSVDDINYIN